MCNEEVSDLCPTMEEDGMSADVALADERYSCSCTHHKGTP